MYEGNKNDKEERRLFFKKRLLEIGQYFNLPLKVRKRTLMWR
jgi:hypothetical protein